MKVLGKNPTKTNKKPSLYIKQVREVLYTKKNINWHINSVVVPLCSKKGKSNTFFLESTWSAILSLSESHLWMYNHKPDIYDTYRAKYFKQMLKSNIFNYANWHHVFYSKVTCCICDITVSLHFLLYGMPQEQSLRCVCIGLCRPPKAVSISLSVLLFWGLGCFLSLCQPNSQLFSSSLAIRMSSIDCILTVSHVCIDEKFILFYFSPILSTGHNHSQCEKQH